MHSEIRKENHRNIFGGHCYIIHMIILHGNIPHEQKRKQKTTIHGERSYNSDLDGIDVVPAVN